MSCGVFWCFRWPSSLCGHALIEYSGLTITDDLQLCATFLVFRRWNRSFNIGKLKEKRNWIGLGKYKCNLNARSDRLSARRWWDLWGRNGPWGREGRHHRSWLSGRWKGTPFPVRKSMHGPNQTASLSVFIQVKKKKMRQLKWYDNPAADSSGEPLVDSLEAYTFGDSRCGIAQCLCGHRAIESTNELLVASGYDGSY